MASVGPRVNGRSGRGPRGRFLAKRRALYRISLLLQAGAARAYLTLPKRKTDMLLPITLTIAGACALLHIWLSMRVSQVRRLHKVSVGDQGNPVVAARMRAHGNFAENMPIFLILLALLELARGSTVWLWVPSILFVLGRILHAFGMDRAAPNKLRIVGIALTWLVLLGLAAWAISLPYLERQQRPGLQLSPVRTSQT